MRAAQLGGGEPLAAAAELRVPRLDAGAGSDAPQRREPIWRIKSNVEPSTGRSCHPLALVCAGLAVALVAACPTEAGGEADCATYCGALRTQCTGASAQYESEAACLETCSDHQLAWAAGALDDSSGNTLGCRQSHAQAAHNDEHCWHAGPTGGGVCGSLCEVYCDAAMTNCTEEQALYGDRDACLDACARLPDDGIVNEPTGDSVQCRLHHLAAARSAPEPHCAHASASGANTCGDLCEVYCTQMTLHCPSEYASPATCATTCATFDEDGALNEVTGDTVQCRINHAVVADDDIHCEYASAAMTADTCQ